MYCTHGVTKLKINAKIGAEMPQTTVVADLLLLPSGKRVKQALAAAQKKNRPRNENKTNKYCIINMHGGECERLRQCKAQCESSLQSLAYYERVESGVLVWKAICEK